MTLPDERYRAVIWARGLLHDLCDPAKTPRVPKDIRRQAYSALRHYPTDLDMKRVTHSCPEVFQERMEPLTRMFTVYKIEQEEEQDDKTI